MELTEEYLKEYNIKYITNKDTIIVTSKNKDVDLKFITEINKKLIFENKEDVYLGLLEKLNKKLVFKNKGDVDLNSLSQLNRKLVFKNGGDIDLESIIKVDKKLVFKNKNHVYLDSITKINKNIIFKNQGYIYLDSLDNKIVTYKNKKLKIKIVDYYTMIIDNEKVRGDYTIYNARYFGGGDLDKLKQVYIAEKSNLFAHGETVKQAIKDVQFKFLQKNLNVNELVSEIKAKSTMDINEYRLLTGACSAGVKHFLEQNKIKETELPLKDILNITKNQYGYNVIKELFL